MKQLQRMLVANDSLEGMESALGKAALIEHYTGAEIQAVTVVYDAVEEEDERLLPRDQRIQLVEALKASERVGLKTVADTIRGHVAQLETQVLWHKQAAPAILDLARRWDVGLLVKPVCEHHRLADFLHTPLDWALMREAPCPVLVSKGRPWNAPRRILAAVDLADPEHGPLNEAILRTAGDLCTILGAELHIATAYPSLGQRVNDLQVAMDFEGIKAGMRNERGRALLELIDRLGLEVAKTHILEGRPGDVIPSLANTEPMTLVVLGTAARRGLAKLLIGNTAEDLVNRIRGDLVSVREAR